MTVSLSSKPEAGSPLYLQPTLACLPQLSGIGAVLAKNTADPRLKWGCLKSPIWRQIQIKAPFPSNRWPQLEAYLQIARRSGHDLSLKSQRQLHSEDSTFHPLKSPLEALWEEEAFKLAPSVCCAKRLLYTSSLYVHFVLVQIWSRLNHLEWFLALPFVEMQLLKRALKGLHLLKNPSYWGMAENVTCFKLSVSRLRP